MRSHSKAASAGSDLDQPTCLVAALLIAAMLSLAIVVPAQAASRAKLGEIPATGASAAGALNNPRELAINQTGAGDASAGDVYVLDGNNRVSEFSATGTFVRTFGYDVVQSGPGNTGVSEQQKLTLKAPGGGKFRLEFNNVATGAAGTGSWGVGVTTITINQVQKGGFAVGQIINSTTAGIQEGTSIVSCSPNPDCSSPTSLIIDKPTTAASGGTTARQLRGYDIPYNATATAVESALNGLSSIAGVGGSVTVSRTEISATEYEFTITFGGSFAGNDVPPLVEFTAQGLVGVGKSAAVTTPVNGGGPEICSASNPTDVCKAGSAVESAGGLNNAQGIAIDPANGNVYVYEASNRRVSVFSAAGVFEGAFGWKVKAGGEAAAALQFCTTAGTGCQAGEGSAAAGGFGASGAAPRNIAIDSSGNLYVPDAGNRRIDVFSRTLNGSNEVTGVSFLRGIGWKVNTTAPVEGLQECTTVSGCQQGTAGAGAGQFRAENPTSVAVDASGAIYAVSNSQGGECSTSAPCRIQKFNADGTIANANFGPASGTCMITRTSAESPASGFTTGPTGRGVNAIAVDPETDHVFALMRTLGPAVRVCEMDSTGALVSEFPPAGLTLGTGPDGGVAIGIPAGPDEEKRIYVANQSPIFILGPVPAPIVGLHPVTEVGQTSARLNGEVTVPSPGGEGFDTIYRFEVSGDNGFNWTKVPASDVSIGSTAGTYPVTQVASGLQPGRNYLVRLTAATGPSAMTGTVGFTTSAARPTVTYPSVNAPLATETMAKAKGFVNPNNASTTYRFEWGTTTSYGHQSPDFDPFVGAGGDPIAVTATISGLQPSTVYHYRLVAINASGITNGEDRMLETIAARRELNAAGLPDDRGVELVSPAEKQPQGQVATQLLGSFYPAEDGNSILFPLLGGLTDTDSGGDTSYLAKRQTDGWQSEKVSPPSLVPSPEHGLLSNASSGSVSYYSPDLSCGIIYTFNPLTDDVPQSDIELGVGNYYIRHADGTYTLTTRSVPSNPQLQPNDDGTGKGTTVFGTASDHCDKIFFESKYEYLPGVSFYEWDEGELRDAATLPDGSSGVGAGGEKRFIAPTAVPVPRLSESSPDGSRFAFSALSTYPASPGRSAVFLREDGGTSVVEVSRKQGGTADNAGTQFQVMSRNGSHVFFLSGYGLTPGSSGGSAQNCTNVLYSDLTRCDLYDYNADTGQLKDLSGTSDPANTAGAVAKGVLAVSDDGASVYFAAVGQLVAGRGNTYAQNLAGPGYANLYLARNEQLHYVATIRRSELNGMLVDGGRFYGGLHVTADGNRVLFETESNVTGYDSGGEPEAYLYSADTDAVTCVSCRPDGQPSVGTNTLFDVLPGVATGSSFTPAISDDGKRIFFTSPDVLALGAVAGNRNIYEWEKGQVYLLFSGSPEYNVFQGPVTKFVGASASGDDVFIKTPQQLTPYDKDLVIDLYDFRVDGGFAPPPPAPVPCNPAADECQGTPTPQPAAPNPPSQSFSGPGNPAAPPAGKPKKQKHKKQRKRRHRKAKKASHSRVAKTNRGGAK